MDAPADASSFTNDPPLGTSFDNNGNRLQVSQGLWEDYQTRAEALADALVSDTSRLAQLAPANPDANARATAFIASFGERAYRRPLSSAEQAAHLALFQRGAELFPGRDAFAAGVQLTVQAALQSPHFIYRRELGEGVAADGRVELSQHEIASRLSYTLWDSMPDDELFRAARAGELHDAGARADQARRMLEDERAAGKLSEFHRQLLELRRYDTLRPQGLPEGIGVAFRAETERFIQDVVNDSDGSLDDLLTASHSFVNADLAGVYGLSGDFGDALERVELDADVRAGLITQAGFLTYRSGDTAPILRGVFINEKLLCTELPPPPVFIPPTMSGNTRRERVESVTGPGTCGATCHGNYINPAGFPLEHFDDVGRYRMLDNGLPIDATAEFKFAAGTQAFDGAVQWAQTIAQSAEAHACYVKHWIEFGYGREVEDGDAPLIARLSAASRDAQLPIKEILVELVKSPAFSTRLAEEP